MIRNRKACKFGLVLVFAGLLAGCGSGSGASGTVVSPAEAPKGAPANLYTGPQGPGTGGPGNAVPTTADQGIVSPETPQ
jgi:hypothetical protein